MTMLRARWSTMIARPCGEISQKKVAGKSAYSSSERWWLPHDSRLSDAAATEAAARRMSPCSRTTSTNSVFMIGLESERDISALQRFSSCYAAPARLGASLLIPIDSDMMSASCCAAVPRVTPPPLPCRRAATRVADSDSASSTELPSPNEEVDACSAADEPAHKPPSSASRRRSPPVTSAP